jgi:hypothetical protein
MAFIISGHSEVTKNSGKFRVPPGIVYIPAATCGRNLNEASNNSLSRQFRNVSQVNRYIRNAPSVYEQGDIVTDVIVSTSSNNDLLFHGGLELPLREGEELARKNTIHRRISTFNNKTLLLSSIIEWFTVDLMMKKIQGLLPFNTRYVIIGNICRGIEGIKISNVSKKITVTAPPRNNNPYRRPYTTTRTRVAGPGQTVNNALRARPFRLTSKEARESLNLYERERGNTNASRFPPNISNAVSKLNTPSIHAVLKNLGFTKNIDLRKQKVKNNALLFITQVLSNVRRQH